MSRKKKAQSKNARTRTTKKHPDTESPQRKSAKKTTAKGATKKAAQKKRTSRVHATEASVSGYPTKQSFVKVAKSKSQKTPRTWVVIYRLVDGPAVPGAAAGRAQRRGGSSRSPAS